MLGVIMLRGPQTVPELLSRTDRMHGFESGAQVRAVLASLQERPEPFVTNIGRASGQREDRWAQLLESADFDAESVTPVSSPAPAEPQRPATPSMAGPTPSSFIRSASAPAPSAVAPPPAESEPIQPVETVEPVDAGLESTAFGSTAEEPNAYESPSPLADLVREPNEYSSEPETGASPDLAGPDAERVAELEAELNALRSEFDQLERRFDNLCQALGEDI